MQKALGRAVFRGRPELGVGGRTQDGKVELVGAVEGPV